MTLIRTMIVTIMSVMTNMFTTSMPRQNVVFIYLRLTTANQDFNKKTVKYSKIHSSP